MNKSSLLGLIAISGVFYFAVFVNARSGGAFLDTNSLMIVLGGTVAVALVAYPLSTLTRSVDFLLWGFLFKKKKNYLSISQDIAGARNSFLLNQSYMTTDESHPFLREAVLFLSNRNIDNKAFKDILKNRSEFFKKKYVDDALVLRSLVKYPMALGILAGLVKLVALFGNYELTTQGGLAHQVAAAFVCVFWGVAASYVLFYPLSDSANKAVEEDQEIRQLIIDGMILIREKATDDHFQAYLRGYLNLSDRSELKIFGNKKGSTPYSNVKAPRIEAKEEVETPSYVEVRETETKIYESKQSRRERRLENNKPDPKPFEKLKEITIVPIAAQEEDRENKAAVIATAQQVQDLANEELNWEATEVAPLPVEASAPPDILFKASESEATMLTSHTSVEQGRKKSREEKTELPGYVEQPVKINPANSTDLETFKFKDLRKELKTRKKA